MQELDRIVKQEIYFELQEIPDTANKEFNELLLWITGALTAGKTTKDIKRYINKQDVDKGLEKNLKRYLGQQYRNITGEKKEYDLKLEAVAGYTFAEQTQERKRSIRARATRFMARAKELMKTEAGVKRYLEEELNRYIKETERFWRDTAKAGREHSYARADELDNRGIRGWMSIAVLDNRTSAICAGLHNNFYSAEQYKTRDGVPDKPPRHPRCRSILITVWEGEDIRNYKGQNLSTFLKRNKGVARDIMGQEKYRLWSEGKAKIDKYIDLKGRRWYRNDEIVERLGIKANSKRLPKNRRPYYKVPKEKREQFTEKYFPK